MTDTPTVWQVIQFWCAMIVFLEIGALALIGLRYVIDPFLPGEN